MKHPSVFEPALFVASIALALLGVVIGLELLTRVGVTPNTSIIGAMLAIALGRLPLAALGRFRDVARQNLLQTVISSATFGGANAVFLPLGVAWLVGGRALMPAMFAGATIGMIAGALVLYWLFDSPVFPASASWPAGVATAECLIAGDRGGRRAQLLVAGGVAGGAGQAIGIPMDVVGICWIGNPVALLMFGLGLLARGYARTLAGIELDRMYIPHGIMIGAGLVALAQIAGSVRDNKDHYAHRAHRNTESSSVDGVRSVVVSAQPRPHAARSVRSGVAAGMLLNIAGAATIAAIAGLHATMTSGAVGAFVLYAAAAALVTSLIVGISAMHAGWFPAFATALIFLVVGMALGFPATALAFIAGFTASGGPAFADLGFDLKTGWIVRGCGNDPGFEREGRRQQLIAAMLGFGVATVFVWMVSGRYLAGNLIPPADRVYAATIAAGASPDVLRRLLAWAVPGALLQLAGGRSRQIGVLLATGLLIFNPIAGWTAIAALLVRALAERRYAQAAQQPMFVLAGGFLAGSALVSFGAATMKSR